MNLVFKIIFHIGFSLEELYMNYVSLVNTCQNWKYILEKYFAKNIYNNFIKHNGHIFVEFRYDDSNNYSSYLLKMSNYIFVGNMDIHDISDLLNRDIKPGKYKSCPGKLSTSLEFIGYRMNSLNLNKLKYNDEDYLEIDKLVFTNCSFNECHSENRSSISILNFRNCFIKYFFINCQYYNQIIFKNSQIINLRTKGENGNLIIKNSNFYKISTNWQCITCKNVINFDLIYLKLCERFNIINVGTGKEILFLKNIPCEIYISNCNFNKLIIDNSRVTIYDCSVKYLQLKNNSDVQIQDIIIEKIVNHNAKLTYFVNNDSPKLIKYINVNSKFLLKYIDGKNYF